MSKKFTILLSLAIMVLFSAAVPTAYAVLERVGPVNNAPSVGGFPSWYQDTTGLTLEFCDPKNAAEVQGGWCLLLPADVPAPPEVFPTEFFDEHFYYSVSADFPDFPRTTIKKFLWEAAVESAFAADVVQGGQMAFSRIRVRLEPLPKDGTYKFFHPYGEESLEGVAGDRIFFTDDVGVACAVGTFGCAMQSRLGPFLLPSNSPGGAELAPVAGPSGLYIADPGRSGPVTGSPIRNFVRIEGPLGSDLDGEGNDFVETSDFSLVGRIFQGNMPGRITIDRASYVRTADAIPQQKVDVFATTLPTVPGRLPGQPRPSSALPQLSFFDAPCGTQVLNPGTANEEIIFVAPPGPATETLMSVAGTNQWGEVQPAVIPSSVCMKDSSALPAPVFFQQSVSDEVSISEASFDPLTQVLTVKAASSDRQIPPTLTLSGFGDLLNGQIRVSPLAAAPANVLVVSSARGTDVEQVTTPLGAPAPGGTPPVAADDSIVTVKGTPPAPVAIDVLANDTDAEANINPASVAIVHAPANGSLNSFNRVTGEVTYAPNLNFTGNDSFTYTVLDRQGNISNIAMVRVTVTLPVNLSPVAANDSATTTLNVPVPINVLVNDSDPDGSLNVGSLAIASLPAHGTALVNQATGAVSYTPGANYVGADSFTYTVRDNLGAISNAVTVNVTVTGTPTAISVTRAQYTAGPREWVIEGTTSASRTTLVIHAGPLTGHVVGADVASAGGKWKSSQRNSPVAPDASRTISIQASDGTVLLNVPVTVK